MIGAGFGLQWHCPVRSFDETVAKVGIAFIVSGVIFVIAVDYLEDIPVDSAVSAPDLGLSEIKGDIESAFPVALKISFGRSFFQIARLSSPGPEFPR